MYTATHVTLLCQFSNRRCRLLATAWGIHAYYGQYDLNNWVICCIIVEIIHTEFNHNLLFCYQCNDCHINGEMSSCFNGSCYIFIIFILFHYQAQPSKLNVQTHNNNKYHFLKSTPIFFLIIHFLLPPIKCSFLLSKLYWISADQMILKPLKNIIFFILVYHLHHNTN